MFDWFWDFLYLLTKSIFRLIDGLITCTNLLCGIEPITVNGEETDMLTWLINNDNVEKGFIVAVLISIFMLVFLSIWQIIKTIASEKPEMTPGQVCVKAFKSIMTFLFIPFCMICIVQAFNVIGKAMYSGTNGGSTQGLGTFLVGAFAQDALNAGISADFYLDTSFDYTNTSACWHYFDLSEFDYFYSWVTGIAILFMMAKVLFIFVERIFSIIVLYIISPIPIATSIVDDGEYFKSWRDQLISKFVVGYGAIVGLNIYSIVISAFATADITFFDIGFLDFLFKLLIIIGGTFALNKIITMIGNLFGKGRANEDLQTAEGMKQGTKAFGQTTAKLAGQGLNKAKNLGTKLGKKLLGLDKKGGQDSGGGSSGGEESDDEGGGNKNPNMGDIGKLAQFVPQLKAAATVANVIKGSKDKKDDNKKDDKKKASPLDLVMALNPDNANKKPEQEKKEGGNKK